jgi:hypothetical protein
MANQKPQSFKNHTRLVPAFHQFVLPVFLVNLAYRLYVLRFGISFRTIFEAVMAVALIVFALYARLFTLTVQDRVIRLEMRLRMAELLPVELRARIPEFTVAQLVSLRFASDTELPALARKVLDEKLTDRKAIKQLIQDWQGDHLRA